MFGGLAGAGMLYLIVINGHAEVDIASTGLGQNGWGSGYLGEYSVTSAFIAEAIATFLFVAVILAATDDEKGAMNAGIAIGFMLAAMIIAFIGVSGASLNPARSFGPAVYVGGVALAQLWVFFVAPLIGALAAGYLFRRPPCN
jgi:aquaporin Z